MINLTNRKVVVKTNERIRLEHYNTLNMIYISDRFLLWLVPKSYQAGSWGDSINKVPITYICEYKDKTDEEITITDLFVLDGLQPSITKDEVMAYLTFN
jgi:hypothetical protein